MVGSGCGREQDGNDPGRSSVKDEEQYEALRREGMSKQELYDDAKQVGVKGRSRMSKSELIDALRSGR